MDLKAMKCSQNLILLNNNNEQKQIKDSPSLFHREFAVFTLDSQGRSTVGSDQEKKGKVKQFSRSHWLLT